MALGNNQLKRIQEKLQVVLRQQASLEKENLQLKENLAAIRNQETEYVETVEKLRQQVEVLRFSNGDMNDMEKKAFEKKLSTYVKEIDRCIAILSV